MGAEWALDVMDRAPYITMAMTDKESMVPYAVPLSMARVDDKTLYFHCAIEGRKLDILRSNPVVCLNAVARCKPTVGPRDGSFTLEFQSAIAYGRVEAVTADEEKVAAMRAICSRFLPQHMDAFQSAVERSLPRTAVFRVTLTEPPVGKRKQYDSHGEEMKYGRME